MGIISALTFPLRRPGITGLAIVGGLGVSVYAFGPIATLSGIAKAASATAAGLSAVAGAFGSAKEAVTGLVTRANNAYSCPAIVTEAAKGISQKLIPDIARCKDYFPAQP